MKIDKIQDFLKGIAANNNKDWFLEHRSEYENAKKEFESGVEQLIAGLATIDTEVGHLKVKDCTYRFYRDVRFSPDKSPYKRHFGAYICAKGRKALRGGYYFHIEPGNNIMAVGCYYLPTNILTSCRNEIMGSIETWLSAVSNERFVSLFGKPNEGHWEDGQVTSRGFGLTALKTCPKGFPKDYPHLDYLRMKDYCCWVKLPDSLFQKDNWCDELLHICKEGKPMMDFINSVVDDYE